MYEYICPYCGEKNCSEFFREYVDGYKRYRTDICASATCHKSKEPVDYYPRYNVGYKRVLLEYHVVTSLDICSTCDERLECVITPVVIATVVPKDKTKVRKRSWREKFRD